jgi:tRNA threonylcarbamoyl adenosine modification protein (Sua5/YciO/YrdC/YwlC family)
MSAPEVVAVSAVGSAEAVRRVAAVLRRGALAVIPTDTVYGVAADPRVPGAVERLCVAKGRDRDKPIPLLAADLAEVQRRALALDALELRLAERFWPGPLTLVLRTATGTEGFRVPDCPIALQLLREGEGVLRVTSANLSGDPPAITAADGAAALGPHVAVVLDAGPAPGGVPSTVARVTGGTVQVIREGVISRERLLACKHG